MKIWIIGAGKFGTRAIRAVRARVATPEFTLIDLDHTRLKSWLGKLNTFRGDGIDYVARGLTRDPQGDEIPDMIVPAAPVHIAYGWIVQTLAPFHNFTPLTVPEEVRKQLPNPIPGPGGEMYASRADFLCPENCNEPRERCTATGKPRGRDLFRQLAEIKTADYRPVVIRSRQLAPGVGGYIPESLFAAREKVAAVDGKVLLSTACRCHGVMHALRITKNRKG